MKVYRLIAIVLLPFYAAAKGIVKVFDMKNKDDMPTIKEWLLMENY